MAACWGVVAVCALGQAVQPARLAGIHPLAVSALLISLAMAALAAAGVLLQRSPARVVLGLEPGSLGVPRMCALAIGTIGVSQLLNTLLVEFGLGQQNAPSEIDRFLAQAATPEYLLILAAFAIGPGIAEEVLFRGLILRSVASAYGSAIALLSSSLLFGLAHSDLARAGAAALLGLYLGAIALRGGSIRACIACHIANNVAAVAWLTLPVARSGSGEPGDAAVALAASAGATAIGFLALATSHHPRHRDPAASR